MRQRAEYGTNVGRIEEIIIYRKPTIVLFDGRIVELKAFVTENARGESSDALVFLSVHPMLSLISLPVSLPPAIDVSLCRRSRRQSQMKALFRRIDKINRVAHDNADNFATIHARPASTHA